MMRQNGYRPPNISKANTNLGMVQLQLWVLVKEPDIAEPVME
jgi:hypothetical protein